MTLLPKIFEMYLTGTDIGLTYAVRELKKFSESDPDWWVNLCESDSPPGFIDHLIGFDTDDEVIVICN